MSSAPKPQPPRDNPENWPVAWFAEMQFAIERGDFGRATEAQRELRRLGWSVMQTRPRQRPHTPRHEADGRGVDR